MAHLNGGTVHAVFAIQELDDITHRIAHSTIVPATTTTNWWVRQERPTTSGQARTCQTCLQ